MDELRARALRLIEQARQASNARDDATAMRLVKESLQLHETSEGLDLQRFFDRFGPGSPAAAAVERVLAKGVTHYDVMKLKASATAKDVKRAYKQLSLELHPDRNHARDAEEAFKRLSTAFCVLSNKQSRAKYDAELRGGGRSHAAGGAGRAGSSTDRTSYGMPPPPQQQERGGPRSMSPRSSGSGKDEPRYGDEPRRDMSVEALLRENAALRAEMHRRRTAETQANVEAAMRQREARAAIEELNAMRRRVADNDRMRREEITSAVSELAAKLAASEGETSALKRELHAKKLALDESRAETESVTAAVNALLNRFEGARGTTPAAFRTTHSRAGIAGNGVGVTVVGSKVGARELVMRLATTLSGALPKTRPTTSGGVGDGGGGGDDAIGDGAAKPAPASRSKAAAAHANPRGFKTMAQLREEVRERRRAETEKVEKKIADSHDHGLWA